MSKKNKYSYALLFVFTCIIFSFYGVYGNISGTGSTAMMRFFGINQVRQGLLRGLPSVVSMSLTIILGSCGDRLNKIYGMDFGVIILGAVSLTMATIPLFFSGEVAYTLSLIVCSLAGFGTITIDLMMNSMVADYFPEKKETLLPIIHAFFGLGSLVSPLLVSLLSDPDHPETYRIPYLVFGIACVTVGALALLNGVSINSTVKAGREANEKAKIEKAEEGVSRAETEPVHKKESTLTIFTDKKAWLYLALCSTFLLFQCGLSSWLTDYCQVRLGYPYKVAAKMLTAYFIGVFIMRFVSPVIYRYLKVSKCFILTSLISTVLAAIFFIFPMQNVSGMYLLMGMIGFLQGASVPGAFLMCCEAFPEKSVSASSIVVMGGLIAGLVSPLLMGWVITYYSHQAAMLTVTAGVPVSVLLLIIAGKLPRKKAE